MVATSAEAVRRTLEDGVHLIGQLAPSQQDEAVTAFNRFRKGVMQASNGHHTRLDSLVGDLEPKTLMLHFLVTFFERKRMYRKHVVAVVAVLVANISWFRALQGDLALCSRLPDDLAMVLAEHKPVIGSDDTIAACGADSSESKDTSSMSTSTKVSSPPIGSFCIRNVNDFQAERRISPHGLAMTYSEMCLTFDGLPVSDDHLRSHWSKLPLVDSHDLSASPMDVEPAMHASQHVVTTNLLGALSWDTQEAVPANGCQEASSEGHSGVPSDAVVRAAVEAAKAMYRRAPWSKPLAYRRQKDSPEVELQATIEFLHRVPQCMDRDEAAVAFEAFRKAISRIANSMNREADHALEDLEPKGDIFMFLVDIYMCKKVHRKQVINTMNLLLRFQSWQNFRGDEAFCANLPLDIRHIFAPWVPEAAHMVAALNVEDTILVGACMDGTCWLPDLRLLVSAPPELLEPIAPLLVTTIASELLHDGLQGMMALSFVASEINSALVAFNKFAHGVREVSWSDSDGDCSVLESLEPKAEVFSFLVDLHLLNKATRNSISLLLSRLLDHTAWRSVAETDERLQTSISNLTGYWGLPARSEPHSGCVALCRNRNFSKGAEVTPVRSRSPTAVAIVKRRWSQSPTAVEACMVAASKFKGGGGSWYSRAITSLRPRQRSA